MSTSSIDPARGVLTFSITGESLGPVLTREEFLGSKLGQSAVAATNDDACKSYEVKVAPGEIGQSPYHVTLRFDDETLGAILVSDDSPEFGLWTTHGEVARKAAHDDWLRAQGVAVGTYPWGKLLSELSDEGGSYVAFLYGPR
jgi:hypothetical protein